MKIIFLAGKGDSTLYVYNAISKEFNVDRLIIEDTLSSKILIKGRLRRLGYFKVINQLFFQIFISKILNYLSKGRKKRLILKLNLDNSPIPKNLKVSVTSVNSKKCIDVINEIGPDVIIVNGTRIIGKKVLDSTNAIIINTHVGITPQYRGVHGGYWALANNDKPNCGVTIHTVDKGIDTGAIVAQATILPEKNDNFSTYPLHQYAAAIPLLLKSLESIQAGAFKTYTKEDVQSKLYYHPTFTSYLYNFLVKGVK